jgi:hypothetical protein
MSTLYDTLTTKVVKECNNSVMVVPNDPSKSALVMLPTWQCTDFVMPVGCIDNPCLESDQMAIITGWIASGAPRP